jgi:hypothetical protein
MVDTTLFWKTFNNKILIVQIYVDDIIFRSANASLCEDFSKCMQSEFEMSMMGEIKFFLGIQINQGPEGSYIHQSKYTKELLKKFDMTDCKPMKTPMHPTCTLGKDENSKKVEKKLFRDMIGYIL